MILHKHLSMADIFSNCQEKFENDKYQFIFLLESTIDLNKFIPISFKNHFYASTVRPRGFTSILKIIFVLIQEPFEILMNVKKPIKNGLL